MREAPEDKSFRPSRRTVLKGAVAAGATVASGESGAQHIREKHNYRKVSALAYFQEGRDLEGILHSLQPFVTFDHVTGLLAVRDEQGTEIKGLSQSFPKEGLASVHVSAEVDVLTFEHAYSRGILVTRISRRLSDGALIATESGPFFAGAFTFDLERHK